MPENISTIKMATKGGDGKPDPGCNDLGDHATYRLPHKTLHLEQARMDKESRIPLPPFSPSPEYQINSFIISSFNSI